MHEGAHTTAAGTPAAATVVRRQRVRRGQTAFAATCYLVSPYVGLTSFTVDSRIAEVWPISGAGFVLLAAVWGTPHR